jgi:hypothetical protein
VASIVLCNAVSLAVQVPATIHKHQEELNSVWDKLSSSFTQLEIYSAIPGTIDDHLYEKLKKVMIGFIRLCAFVIVIQNGTKGAKWKENFTALYSGQTKFHDELDSFEKAKQDFRNVEGSATYATANQIKNDVKDLLNDSGRVRDLEAIATQLNLPTEETDPSVQLTRYCSGILRECIPSTGSWILTHPLYNDWTDVKNQDARLLVVRGPQSSGKTFLSAIVAKALGDSTKLRYVAHHTFMKREKKGERVNNLVQSAVMQMAFRLACLDSAIQRTLSDKRIEISRDLSQTDDNLITAWDKLNIGASQSKSTYYLIFDGLENLFDQEFGLVQKFIKHLITPSPPQNQVQDQPNGRLNKRIRILITLATDSSHKLDKSFSGSPEIDISQENMTDLEEYTRTTLGTQLDVVPRDSREHFEHQIMKRLPMNAQGRYTNIDVGLAKVMRLVIGGRHDEKNIDAVLEDPTKIQKEDIEEIQQVLTTDDIKELNDVIRWVFASEGHSDSLTLEQLDSASVRKKPLSCSCSMLTIYQKLQGPRKSLITMEHLITTKYSSFLNIEDGCVYLQNGVADLLTTLSKDDKDKDTTDEPTITMNITIHKASQDECAAFFWDLAHTAVKAKDEFLLDHGSRMYSHKIMTNAFDATKSVVLQVFRYLSNPPPEGTEEIGVYIVSWLPSYLERLEKLGEKEKVFLTTAEEKEIRKGLYDLFSSSSVIEHHSNSFQKATWWKIDIKYLENWLSNGSTMTKPGKWLRQQSKSKPVAGFLEKMVSSIVDSFLRARIWDVSDAYRWISLFMRLVSFALFENRL